MVDVGSSIFEKGQAYVALSRCRSLNGLHLIGLNSNRLMCDPKAWNEYSRLRKENGLQEMCEANSHYTEGAWRKPSATHIRTNKKDTTKKTPLSKHESSNRKRRATAGGLSPTVPKRARNTDASASAAKDKTQIILRFQNAAENHCFINSTIQAFLSLGLPVRYTSVLYCDVLYCTILYCNESKLKFTTVMYTLALTILLIVLLHIHYNSFFVLVASVCGQ